MRQSGNGEIRGCLSAKRRLDIRAVYHAACFPRSESASDQDESAIGLHLRKLNTIRDQSLPSDPNFGSTTDLIITSMTVIVRYFLWSWRGVSGRCTIMNNDDIDG